jgi:3-oxoacyl-[acyl-carrier-protein] synthase-3
MAVPDKVITNAHFESYLETSDEWIRDRTGIEERRWVEGDIGVSELAEPAARQAIARAGLSVDDIDAIVFATVTPDLGFPSSACCLQRRLGMSRGFAFDVNAVCSGFLYALVTADSLICRGICRHALVVGADIFSKIINPQDRTTCVLFGDGAGAVVLSSTMSGHSGNHTHGGTLLSGRADSVRGIYGSLLSSDGRFSDILKAGCGTANPASEETMRVGGQYLTMAGKEVFKLAVRYLGDISAELLQRLDIPVEAVDFFVSHQANKRILMAMARQLKVPEEKVLCNVEHYGNTSAASVPLLLAEAMEQGTVKQGDLLLLSAFGGGITWGAALLRL